MSKSLKLSEDLQDLSELRAKQLGYPSWSAYIKGLIRYDTMVNGPHQITQPLSPLPLAEQDSIDSKLLDNAKRGISQRGQYLKLLIDRTNAKKKKKASE